jgi:hypothetical protein
VVDAVAPSAALTEYLPVVEPGDKVFDRGSNAAVKPVVAVADDAAGVVASWGGDRQDAAIAPVAERGPSSRCATVWRATMTSWRLPGQH